MIKFFEKKSLLSYFYIKYERSMKMKNLIENNFTNVLERKIQTELLRNNYRNVKYKTVKR